MEPQGGGVGGLTTIILAIIAVCLTLRLLSVVPYPDPNPEFERFLIGHTLDPTSGNKFT